MDKSTYKTLSTMTADLQRRFDFVFKAIKIEPVPSVAEDSGMQEQEPEQVQNPLAPVPAEVAQGLDSTSHQEESKTALEDTSSLAYTDLPEAASSSSSESGLQGLLDYIMKVTSSPNS